MPLRAICFDLDGLLADTEPHYFEAHRSILAEHGVTISTEEYTRRWIIEGTHWADEAARYGIDIPAAELSAESRRRFRALVDRNLGPMPGALEVLRRAAARGPTALVTNTHHEDAERVVERLGFRPFLVHLVTRERYERAKPEPDGYLAAAAVLGAAPADCLALEDSPRGMRAALAAGLPCVLVLNDLTRLGGREAVAARGGGRGPLQVLDSLADLDLEGIAAGWLG